MFNATSALNLTKFVVSGVVGLGAGKIAKSIIANNVSAETLVDKVTTVAGAWAIGGMVATAAKNHTDKTIDDTYGYISKIVDRVKLNEKLNRINAETSTFEQEGLDRKNFVQDLKTKKWTAVKLVDEPFAN